MGPNMTFTKKHVLVVDDNPHIRTLLKENLEDCGYEVATAQNGQEAIDYLDEGNDPVLIVTDIMMPKKQGIEMIQEVRAKYRYVKVLAISGGGATRVGDVLARAQAAGSDAVLAKPFNMQDFERTVVRLTA